MKQNPPRIVAFDLALATTGWADESGAYTLITSPHNPIELRLWSIADLVSRRATAADLVVIEGPVTRSQAATVIGMVHGAVRLWLHQHCRQPPVEVPPAALKKYATGKGNAPKEAMVAAAIRRLGYEGHSGDEADALWLRAMAMDAYGHPVAAVPQAHREALAKVPWPELAINGEGDE